MKKRFIFIILIAFFLFFGNLYYKKINNGNNRINKIDIAEKFLDNTKKYSAEIEVKVSSNKNEINFSLKQKEDENYSLAEVTKGNNIEGLKIELKDNTLRVTNTKLNLEKIYENYNDISNNNLFLSTFIKEYKDSNNKTELDENENEIILKLELKKNRYIRYKELYLSKKSRKPVKMLVKDSYKSKTTSIIYNNIKMQ